MNHADTHPDPPSGPLTVLHADQWLVAFDKPVPMLSVPGIGPEKADCLVARAQHAFPGARIIHRLDRDTSGVIVLAMDADTHRAASIAFQDRQVEKHYEAVVMGTPNEDQGTIDIPIRKDLEDPPRQCVDVISGKPSITHWRVLDRMGDRTRVHLRPLTGRSHQLRLHLKYIGHPIIGDDLYAPIEGVAMSNRLCLHATSLRMQHPVTNESITIESAAPF